MSLENFVVNDKNLNDEIGGGGCLCSPERKPTGCVGPFVSFPAAQITPEPGFNNLSPYPVIGAACVKAMAKKIQGEALSAGEDGSH